MKDFDQAGSSSENPSLEIGIVERETGIPKDTLRIWERRYGFPRPIRSTAGRREYSGGDVIKLRLLKRLIDQGHPPRVVVSQPVDTLRTLLDSSADRAARGQSQIRLALELISDSKIEELSRWITMAHEMLDTRSFILDCVRPLCRQIGEAWTEKRLSIGCEHIVTEKLQLVLRQTIAAASCSSSRPKVLLTTPPGEKHGLGLLMIRALLSCDGVACVSLGTETPIDEIVKCVELIGVRIVGISISGSYGKTAARRFLRALRDALPPGVDIWAGGAGVGEISDSVVGVNFLPELESVTRIFERHPTNR